MLFSCAVVVDKDPCLVTHKPSGRKKEFESFTHFMQFLKEGVKVCIIDSFSSIYSDFGGMKDVVKKSGGTLHAC